MLLDRTEYYFFAFRLAEIKTVNVCRPEKNMDPAQKAEANRKVSVTSLLVENLLFRLALRKHAYSNTLKISPP